MIVGSVATMTGGVSPPTSPPPVAAFSYLPVDPNAGEPTYFQDLSTNNPASWSWTVNGVEFSTQQNPSYYFNVPANYTIALTATNAFGSNTQTQSVFVDRPGSGDPITP